jgi:MFS family permease
LSPTFRSLHNRNYRLYASGAVVSNVGTWMQRIAQDWLVLQLTHNSGTALGITTGLQFLPILLLSPYAGLVADRFPKRRLLQVTQTMLAVPALVLGLLAVTGVALAAHPSRQPHHGDAQGGRQSRVGAGDLLGAGHGN